MQSSQKSPAQPGTFHMLSSGTFATLPWIWTCFYTTQGMRGTLPHFALFLAITSAVFFYASLFPVLESTSNHMTAGEKAVSGATLPAGGVRKKDKGYTASDMRNQSLFEHFQRSIPLLSAGFRSNCTLKTFFAQIESQKKGALMQFFCEN